MDRYLCIHGHFYQPPRENAWLEAVEIQDSSYPYHDWNDRITAECYAPNAAARVLDAEGRIEALVNNYARMSFNFGPTLLSWLAENRPAVYRAVIEADRASREAFSGHGSAVAQAYSHPILPLANRRDKATQVAWGIADFERRYGRRPEGFWLPETAVDLESLELLAEAGILFTVLSPHQAGRIRPLDGAVWEDVSGGRIDPTRAYAVPLPSGKTIAAFFYDGPVSMAVAFGQALADGETLVRRLAGAFSDGRGWPQLVHIATDGETYGHHRRHAEAALAFALRAVEGRGLARLTSYGAFLEAHPPSHAVEILENTSWSCPHGIERWRSDCGCSTGAHPGWTQAWRAPLRRALDALRDELAPLYEARAGELFGDPWRARDEYIEVLLDRSPETIGRFLSRQAGRGLGPEETVAALRLLELQRHALLMYTSCGWFFDDISGIEATQVLQYAGRAVQLAEELFGRPFEPAFLEALAAARSNDPARGDGRRVYETAVKPARLDLPRVGAHYAVRSLFQAYGPSDRIYCYDVERRDFRTVERGKARLALGEALFTSRITRESALLGFAVYHLGDQNLSGGIRAFPESDGYRASADRIQAAAAEADAPAVLRAVDQAFGPRVFSLKSLFRDEQRAILAKILEPDLAEAVAAHRRLYERHAGLLRFLADLGVPVPRDLLAAAESALNAAVREALSAETLDAARLLSLTGEAGRLKVPLDAAGHGHALQRRLEAAASAALAEPESEPRWQALAALADLACSLAFEIDLGESRNIVFRLRETACGDWTARAERGDGQARARLERLAALEDRLRCRVP